MPKYHSRYRQGRTPDLPEVPVVVVVVEFCFGKRVFPDLFTVLLPPVDFVLVSVGWNGTAPAYKELGDGK